MQDTKAKPGLRAPAMFAVIMVVMLVDQLAKAWITLNLQPRESRDIIEGFVRLRYTQNTGAAFGILQGWTGALSIVAIAIIVTIVFSASRVGAGSRWATLALGFIVGGAVGNLIDRLRLGYVIDFVEVYGPRVHLNETVYTFPVFNAADSAITGGVILLLGILLLGKHEPAPAETLSQSSDEGEAALTPALHEAGAQPTAPVKATRAGWGSMVLIAVGFLLMALRQASRTDGSGGR